MTTKTLDLADLLQFTGTETWYRHGLVRKVLFTDGAKYIADHGGAYWLLDEIALAQFNEPVASEAFKVWKLSVHDDHTATLVCEDGDDHIVMSKALTFTDFPLKEIIFYFTDNVILLPTEY